MQIFTSEAESLHLDIIEAIKRNHTVDVMSAWLVLQKITKELETQLNIELVRINMETSK